MKYNKVFLLCSILAIIGLLWFFDIFQYIQVERINELTAFINSFGLLAPIVFIVIYIVATVFFLPGVPLTLLAGLVFGPILGTIWVSIASTVGATCAFIVGRYIGRDAIVKKFSESALFTKLDQGVKKQGWKMVAITRLVPIFPFNAQNYVYGITDIPLRTYAFVSWICMLPGTIGYVFLAGAIIGGQGDSTKTITYIGVGIGFVIGLSIVSKVIMKRMNIEKDK